MKILAEKLNITDFQKFVCKLWKEEGETLKMGYQKEHQEDPPDFKTFYLSCHLMLKCLGVEITKD